MPNITVNNRDYDLDSLSDEAKAQISSLQFVESELARLAAQTAVLQTARIAYGNALTAALPMYTSDTIKFN
jgi:Family of unknown function (DUF6447)